jgi:hypothetical protein
MTPTKAQRLWCERFLPARARPIDFIPRAYLIHKPAPGCAVFALPYEDARKCAQIGPNPELYCGEIVHSNVGPLQQGEWRTLCYAEIKGASILWYQMPLIPLQRAVKGKKR